MQIQFYHLLTSPLEVALPRLADIAVQRKLRSIIVAQSPMLELLDGALWSFSQESFLPHKILSDCQEGEADLHPLVLDTAYNTIYQADICMVTNNHYFDELPPVQRIFDIFNGNDKGATEQARTRWAAYKARGIHLTYIKQKDKGGWETMMNVNSPESKA